MGSLDVIPSQAEILGECPKSISLPGVDGEIVQHPVDCIEIGDRCFIS